MTNSSIKHLSQQWDLGAIKKISRFKSGQVNKSYYIKTGQGEYVLRIYRYKKEKEIFFETSLLGRLRGLLVPEIVPVNGKEIMKIGSSLTIVYKYIPGQCLKKFTAQQRKAVGQALAKIHSRTRGFKWPSERNEYYNFTSAKINLFSRTVAKSLMPLKARFQEMKEDINRYRLSPALPQGAIHVDVKPENVLFRNGRLSGIIDFDNSYIGPLLLDLAKTIAWFALDKKKLNLNYAKDIYRGYVAGRKLAAREYKELYKAIKFAYASHLFDVFYMASVKRNSLKYFRFLMDDFYSSYKSFNLSEQDFYNFI